MRGSKAKKIRREVYGDYALRPGRVTKETIARRKLYQTKKGR